MPFVDPEQVPSSKVPKPFERELKVIMSPETHDQVRDFTMLYSTLAPDGGCTDMHAHDKGGELMIFMSGRGKAFMDGREYELKPGAVLYAPPGVEHKTLNTGTEPLRIACVFIPPADAEYIRKNIAAADHSEA